MTMPPRTEQKWWEVFPWQTPKGEGFRMPPMPWSQPPEQRPQLPTYGGELGFPDLSNSQYLDKLWVYLMRELDAGRIQLGGEEDMGGDSVYGMYNEASDRVTWEGVNPSLPLFPEIIRTVATPEWQAEQKKEYEESVKAWEQDMKKWTHQQALMETKAGMQRLGLQTPPGGQRWAAGGPAPTIPERPTEQWTPEAQRWAGQLGTEGEDFISRFYRRHGLQPIPEGTRTSFAEMTPMQRGADIMGGRRQGQDPMDLAFRPIYGRDYFDARGYQQALSEFEGMKRVGAERGGIPGAMPPPSPFAIATPGSIEEAGAIRRAQRKGERGEKPKQPVLKTPEGLPEFVPDL